MVISNTFKTIFDGFWCDGVQVDLVDSEGEICVYNKDTTDLRRSSKVHIMLGVI